MMDHMEAQMAHFIKLNPVESHISTKGNCDRGIKASTQREVIVNIENVLFHLERLHYCDNERGSYHRTLVG